MTTTDQQGTTKQGVPWIHPVEWNEMLQFTQQMCDKLGNVRGEVMEHIDTIVTLYQELDVSLSRLCDATCPSCTDVCCTIATVWYDQRDILTYHLATGDLPNKQVSRDGTGICCHLGDKGCMLPRLERPFICTWYICKAQTAILRSEDNNPNTIIQEQIQRIKECRKKIEQLCLQI